MTRASRLSSAAAIAGALGVATMATLFGTAASPKFLPDDPVWIERDSQDASEMTPVEPELFVEFAYNVITGRGVAANERAQNINTVDQVPDSSWFTNRLGRRPITADDITAGPNTTSGPASGAWTVTASKSDGVTPGFTVKDSNGQRWFLKFDPPGYRGMATGTEVAVTKLMWALGYNVPENHIAYMRRDQLVVGNGARFTPAGGGKPRALRSSDIDRLLERAGHEADGTYRVVASKALEGKPIGRIRFLDTRPDDPNDVIPHEHRRELRGYGTFAAWLNHVDAKGINSLDMLVTKNNRSFVRHNLIDFGSSLGSGALAPAEHWAGTQHLVDPGRMGKQMAGFGFVRPQWSRSDFYESRSIGRLPLDNRGFDPEDWHPREPNHAFLRARLDDKFWAAEKLMAMTTDLIRAAVAAGDFGDPASEAFLVQALAERRDAILRAYLPAVNPIASPALGANGTLEFRNLAVDADVAKAPEAYHSTWRRFDNTTGETRWIGESHGTATSLPAPTALAAMNGDYLEVQVSATSAEHEAWSQPVRAYFHRTANGWTLVGFERLPESLAVPASTH